MARILGSVFVFVSVPFLVSMAESCLKHTDCHRLSVDHYCCRGMCVTSATAKKEDHCVRPFQTDSLTGYIVMGAFIAIAVVLAIILCFTHPRCPCYKCRSPGQHSSGGTLSPGYRTSPALTNVTLTSPGQIYPVAGVPQGISRQEPRRYLPPYSTTDPSGKGKEQQQCVKEDAKRETLPPPYTAWEDRSLTQTLSDSKEQ